MRTRRSTNKEEEKTRAVEKPKSKPPSKKTSKGSAGKKRSIPETKNKEVVGKVKRRKVELEGVMNLEGEVEIMKEDIGGPQIVASVERERMEGVELEKMEVLEEVKDNEKEMEEMVEHDHKEHREHHEDHEDDIDHKEHEQHKEKCNVVDNLERKTPSATDIPSPNLSSSRSKTRLTPVKEHDNKETDLPHLSDKLNAEVNKVNPPIIVNLNPSPKLPTITPKKEVVPAAKGKATNRLFVSNFVRPFTERQVRELLGEKGKIVEFWMDTIKTHSYVTYETVEEAIATRNNIYNLQWPKSGKKLIAEFSDGNKEVVGGGKIVIQKGVKETVHEKMMNKGGEEQKEKREEPQKAEKSHGGNATGSGMQKEKSQTHNQTKGTTITKVEKDEGAVNILDTLFMKTKTKPHLYYLPLTEQQAHMKIEKDKKHEKEREIRRTERNRERRADRDIFIDRYRDDREKERTNSHRYERSRDPEKSNKTSEKERSNRHSENKLTSKEENIQSNKPTEKEEN